MGKVARVFPGARVLSFHLSGFLHRNCCFGSTPAERATDILRATIFHRDLSLS